MIQKFNSMNVTLKVSLISSFFQSIITTAFLPFIALYLSDMVNARFSGIFLSVLVIITLPISLVSGHIVDHFSKRHLVLTYQLGMAVALFCMAMALLQPAEYLVYFCIAYVFFTILNSLEHPAMDAIVMDAVTPDVEKFIFKFGYWLNNTATAIGMLLGAAFYQSNKALMLFIAALTFFLVFIALLKWIPQTTHIKMASSYNIKDIFSNYGKVIKDKTYILLMFAFSLLLSAELSMSSYVALRLERTFESFSLFTFHIDGVKMFSNLMVTNTISVVLFSYVILQGNKYFKEKHFLIIGFALYLIGYVSLTYLNSFSLLLIAMLLATSGEIIYSPIYQEKQYKLIPEDMRGSYSAFGSLGFHFSELISRFGILLGTFLSVFGMSIYMTCIILIGAICMYIAVYRPLDRRTV